MKAIFEGLCPNCGGTISDDRLALGLPCSKCLPRPVSGLDKIVKNLEREGELVSLYVLDKKAEEFRKWFKKCIGSDPWNLQEVWARRAFLGRSFAILAPTGIGKTTFGLALSTFLDGKAYLLFPTTLLVKQAKEKLENWPHSKKVLAYHSGLKKKEKEEAKKAIEEGKFDILITTTMFLYREFECLKKNKFQLIFVDDVDSFLKTAKNIDKALMLLGFSERDIELAMKVVELKRRLAGKPSPDTERELERLTGKLEKIKQRKFGIMIVSSATAKPRSKRVKLFRELLDFEVGKTVSTLRNIDDYKLETDDPITKTVELVKSLGKGGLVFVPSTLGKSGVEKVKEKLVKAGINSATYEELDKENVEGFKSGKIQVLIGIASYRNPLARGLDLPQHIRYAIFAGVPRMAFPLKLEDNPRTLLALMIMLRPLLDDRADFFIGKLRKYENLPPELIESERYKHVLSLIQEAKAYLGQFLEKEDFLEKVKETEDISIEGVSGQLRLVVGDVAGYIQASGRTSRMYSGGISKGLSILLVDDRKAYNRLVRQIRWFIDDFEFKEFSWEDVEKTLLEVDRTREEIKLALEGKARKEIKSFVKTAGVIVESPNKARTIASFFGKPLRRLINGISVYEVNTGEYILNIMASQGHVLDLVTSPGLYGVLEENGKFIPIYDTIKRCKVCGYQFTEGNKCPRCGSKEILDKSETIRAIRELAKEVNLVLIASDPDTEGEKIAWDIFLAVRPYSKVKRIEFHEVTKRAFLDAVRNMREIDGNLVNAQITRRITDRWVGFSLSQVLQRVFRNKGLSAGRVQSPVLNWIIERWLESRKKKPVTRIWINGKLIELEGKASGPVLVKLKEEKEEEIHPAPPYSTDTMLRDASKAGLDTTRAMSLAQDLFEAGLITYHRTDSTRVSNFGINLAREYISRRFGEEMFQARSWKSTEGAHECIRPTKPMDVQQLKQFLAMRDMKLSREHLLLYDLIFKRFIKSQMRPVKAITRSYLVSLGPLEKEISGVYRILEDGWNLVSPIPLLDLEPGQYKANIETRLVPRARPYTTGEIVAKMKEEGIGRPSTYAKIIQTLLDRGYVIQKSGLLIPTKKGILVNKFLQARYRDLVSVEFTRELEEEMDEIEKGKDYQKVLNSLLAVISSKLKSDVHG